LSQMNKCRHCGVFVPVEKAFCPNCSEPIEPEEAPNRAASSSSDMMATMRDEPENYKELLALKQQLANAQKKTPAPTSDPTPAAVSAASYSAPSQVAPAIAQPAKNKRNLVPIIGAVTILILIVVLLLIFKVI
jgi:hypothetical protein